MVGIRVGQARIIEAVMASILIFAALTAAFFMLLSSEKFFKQETVDLNRLAYNVLHRLAESGIIDEVVDDIQSGKINLAETKMLRTLQSLLPQNIYFNLTIRERSESDQWNSIQRISNAEGIFELSSEVASASLIYTSNNGKIYYLTLSLARVGLL